MGATLIPTTVGFEDIDLEYWDKERHLVKHESFLKELPNIIFKSQNYRNTLIEVYYDLSEEDLTAKDVDYIVGVLLRNFRNYSNYLFILPEDRKSIWLYLPRVDSLSKIKEQIEICIKECSISRRLADGITPLTAHFSVVCYPYSDVNEIFPDLRYAKRQGKVINFYIPNRLSVCCLCEDRRYLSINSRYLHKLHERKENLLSFREYCELYICFVVLWNLPTKIYLH